MVKNDSSGLKVREIDGIELAGKNVYLTAHKGSTGYPNQKVFQKQIFIDPTIWHKIKVRVKPDNIKWFIDGKLMYEVNEYFGEDEYYIWISIIMSLNYQDPTLPKDAKMEIKNLKVIK